MRWYFIYWNLATRLGYWQQVRYVPCWALEVWPKYSPSGRLSLIRCRRHSMRLRIRGASRLNVLKCKYYMLIWHDSFRQMFYFQLCIENPKLKTMFFLANGIFNIVRGSIRLIIWTIFYISCIIIVMKSLKLDYFVRVIRRCS